MQIGPAHPPRAPGRAASGIIPPMTFSITHRSTQTGARGGLLTLPHAPEPIRTPVFMPVGTRGTVKAMTQEEVWELGYRLILGNTYHLYLRPGHDLVHAWQAACTSSSPGTGPC